MMISIKSRICFISMPKCASTSLEKAFEPYCDIVLSGPPGIKHMGANAFYKKVRPIVNNATKDKIELISLFREPIEWLESWYRYRSRESLKGSKNYTGNIEFSEFIRSYINGQDKPYSRVGSQYNTVILESGELGVDHLFKYEDIKSAVDFIEKKLNVSLTVNKLNVSETKEKLYLPEVLRDELKVFLKKEYSIYETI